MKKLFLASDFGDKGGWLLDSQFIETVGVPYLLAHGLANPVADATAGFTVEKAGEYRLWAYTYNWNAPWKPEYAPGIFDVLLGDASFRFGDKGNAWGWQEGGTVSLPAGECLLTLHDLTGCEGRCAALLLTDEEGEPMSPAEYIPEPTAPAASYDYIVVGGGITGITAALSAARRGLRTALVQDRPVVGGNNSSEVRVWLSGKVGFSRFPKLGDVMNELEQKTRALLGTTNRPENYEDGMKLGKLTAEENITLYLSHSVIGAKVTDGTIREITLLDLEGGKKLSLAAPLYADCTGDAVLGAVAGADFEMTTSGHMEQSNFWCVEDVGVETPFPRCPFAIDLTNADFRGRLYAGGTNPEGERESARELGCWYWGAGFEHDPIKRAEYARDTNFRAMYGAWDALKNVDGDFKTYRLAFSAHISGKRESRRLLGPIVLTKEDLLDLREYEDGIVGIDWGLDLHTPNRKYYPAYVEGDAFLCNDGLERFEPPYYLPYRCLYSRNVSNLFMGGRCVSVTHDALGPVRVMRTCGMMGEVIGTAASICHYRSVSPDGLYREHLTELFDSFR